MILLPLNSPSDKFQINLYHNVYHAINLLGTYQKVDQAVLGNNSVMAVAK